MQLPQSLSLLFNCFSYCTIVSRSIRQDYYHHPSRIQLPWLLLPFSKDPIASAIIVDLLFLDTITSAIVTIVSRSNCHDYCYHCFKIQLPWLLPKVFLQRFNYLGHCQLFNTSFPQLCCNPLIIQLPWLCQCFKIQLPSMIQFSWLLPPSIQFHCLAYCSHCFKIQLPWLLPPFFYRSNHLNYCQPAVMAWTFDFHNSTVSHSSVKIQYLPNSQYSRYLCNADAL